MLGLLMVLALASPADTAPPRPRLLVLEPKTKTVDEPAVSSLTGALVVELARDPRLDVVAAGDVADLAALEAEKQAMGCDTTGCDAEIADALGARYVMSGDINIVGDTTVLNLRVLDTTTGAARWRLSLQDGSLSRLIDHARPELRAVGDAVGAGAVDENAVLVGGGPSASAFNTGLVLLGGGAVVVVGSLVGDVFSPTSTNARLDAFDWAFVAGYGVGAAAIVAGGVLVLTNLGAPADVPAAATAGAAP